MYWAQKYPEEIYFQEVRHLLPFFSKYNYLGHPIVQFKGTSTEALILMENPPHHRLNERDKQSAEVFAMYCAKVNISLVFDHLSLS